MFNPLTYIVGFVLFFFAAFTKGMIGFGVNIVAIPIMSLLVGPKAAIAIVTLPSFLNNVIVVVQWYDKDSLRIVRRIIPVLISGAIGITLGTFLLVSLQTDVIKIILGIFSILFVLTDKVRSKWQIQPHQERYWAMPTGFAAGILGGVTGITGPIIVAYLYSLKLDKRQFVYAISTLFLMFTAAQGLNLWALGLYTPESALIAFSFIIPLIIGTLAGNKAQTKISQPVFNRLVLIALLITGLDLLRRGLGWV